MPGPVAFEDAAVDRPDVDLLRGTIEVFRDLNG